MSSSAPEPETPAPELPEPIHAATRPLDDLEFLVLAKAKRLAGLARATRIRLREIENEIAVLKAEPQ